LWVLGVWLGVYIGAAYSVWFPKDWESAQGYVPRTVNLWIVHFKAPPPPPKPVMPWLFAQQEEPPHVTVTWGFAPAEPQQSQLPADRWNRMPY